ncbi:MAG: hypothetical protein Ct9H90mP16_03410 [Candidatus Poseidoniales archaeon]|nr:MAG: hypothetical protein Ct9H90mP16_03410 [Candidatus Poseidoniales archaeon]
MMAIGVHLFDRSRRHEEEVIVVGIVAGFLYAIRVAAAGHGWSADAFPGIQGQYALTGCRSCSSRFAVLHMVDYLDFEQMLIALALRGRLQEGGPMVQGFNQLPAVLGKEYNPLYAGLGVWLPSSHLQSWHLKSLESADAIFLNQHVGFFWAFFTGLIAMFVAFLLGRTLANHGSVISPKWVLYRSELGKARPCLVCMKLVS